MAFRLGVWNKLPLAKAVPPVGVLNQLTIPPLALACSVTSPEPQRVAGTVAVMVGLTLIVARTGVLTEVQLPLVTSA